MLFKKGDLVEIISTSINDNKVKHLYFILSVKEKDKKYVSSKVYISNSCNNNLKFCLTANNGSDILFFKYDNLCILDEGNIRISDYKLYLNKKSMITKIYDIRLCTKSERIKEQRNKSIIKRKNKRIVRHYADICKNKTLLSSPSSVKGISDLNYKGYIKIVRG